MYIVLIVVMILPKKGECVYFAQCAGLNQLLMRMTQGKILRSITNKLTLVITYMESGDEQRSF